MPVFISGMDARLNFRQHVRPMFRRVPILCVLLAWTATTAWTAPRGRTVTLTIATANLTDNTSQAYDDPGIRILQALDPDIVGIQEFNYKLGTSRDLVHRLFGNGHYFSREKGGARLPNGVISRYPITAFGQWDDPYVGNRNFAWATIDIPGPKPLHVVSVHLVHNRSERRAPEARHLLKLIRAQFPEDDYIVLCGDLNVNSREAEALAILTAWFDDSAQPADQAGNKNTNGKRSRPYDFVLPNPALARHHVPTVLAGQKFPGGLVFDSRLWNPPPPPAEWEDSSRDMQHMPVMKTFRIPLH
jgi:endonuclease/exonuclease/phosphatase family metal-dependent hydrolase